MWPEGSPGGSSSIVSTTQAHPLAQAFTAGLILFPENASTAPKSPSAASRAASARGSAVASDSVHGAQKAPALFTGACASRAGDSALPRGLLGPRRLLAGRRQLRVKHRLCRGQLGAQRRVQASLQARGDLGIHRQRSEERNRPPRGSRQRSQGRPQRKDCGARTGLCPHKRRRQGSGLSLGSLAPLLIQPCSRAHPSGQQSSSRLPGPAVSSSPWTCSAHLDLRTQAPEGIPEAHSAPREAAVQPK